MFGYLAKTLSDTELVKGSTKLITDATGVLSGFALGLTALLVIVCLVKKQNAEDEGEAKQIKKKLKSIVICGVGITVASGLISVIFSYFK